MLIQLLCFGKCMCFPRYVLFYSHYSVLNQMPKRPVVKTELQKINPSDVKTGLDLDFI